MVELEFHNGIENIPLGRLWQGVGLVTVGAPNASISRRFSGRVPSIKWTPNSQGDGEDEQLPR